MYGGEDDPAAARRIEIMRQQAAASPTNNAPMNSSAGSLTRQQLPPPSVGFGIDNSSPPTLFNPDQSAPFSRLAGMNGGEGTLTNLQEKNASASPRVTPPSYRNRATAASEGGLANYHGGQFGSANFAHFSLDTTTAVTSTNSLLTFADDSNSNTKRGVPHIYHDYSQVPVQPDLLRKKSGGVTVPFPVKLYEMLEDPQTDPNVISWLPHGRAFLVKQPKRFMSEVMPKYFRQTRVTSFQRQNNLYGFRRLTRGADGGAYYHPMFLRGRPDLCHHMRRQKVKGTGHKQPSDARTEPNFYAMPPVSASPGGVTSDTTAAAFSPQVQAAVPPEALANTSPGLHGAAHLLRGFAGVSPNRVPPQMPLLGANVAASLAHNQGLTPLLPPRNNGHEQIGRDEA
ncbi:hypothetical protein MPSEU_000534700 [Mayamaea pseudoterrestris]|nr:hypothetical protein MPSEU_000534700 [Mayamaea pseudoterrestris]